MPYIARPQPPFHILLNWNLLKKIENQNVILELFLNKIVIGRNEMQHCLHIIRMVSPRVAPRRVLQGHVQLILQLSESEI